jgi:hypothetical protein
MNETGIVGTETAGIIMIGIWIGMTTMLFTGSQIRIM